VTIEDGDQRSRAGVGERLVQDPGRCVRPALPGEQRFEEQPWADHADHVRGDASGVEASGGECLRDEHAHGGDDNDGLRERRAWSRPCIRVTAA
jgi:hypothetical protein